MKSILSLIPFGIILTGLLGSLHCAGMCGPLILATTQSKVERIIYNIGRLFGYLLLGSVMGSLGNHLFNSSYLRVQLWSTYCVGGILVVIGLQKLFPIFKIPVNTHVWSKLLMLVMTPFKRATKSLQSVKSLIVGFATAFLPCGFLYGIVLAAVLTQNAWKGVLLLFCFWAGTLPVMYFFPGIITKKLSRFKTLSPFLVSTVFILSGFLVLYFKLRHGVGESCCQ